MQIMHIYLLIHAWCAGTVASPWFYFSIHFIYYHRFVPQSAFENHSGHSQTKSGNKLTPTYLCTDSLRGHTRFSVRGCTSALYVYLQRSSWNIACRHLLVVCIGTFHGKWEEIMRYIRVTLWHFLQGEVRYESNSEGCMWQRFCCLKWKSFELCISVVILLLHSQVLSWSGLHFTGNMTTKEGWAAWEATVMGIPLSPSP